MATNVLFALSLFRHGDRTFIHKDGWKDENDPVLTNFIDENEGYGQLTAVGIDMHQRVGRYMRERYDHLLGVGDRRAHHAVYVHSTQYDRTLQSAQAQLSTLFPGGFVPVHTASPEKEWLLRGSSGNLCNALRWNESRSMRRYNETTTVNVPITLDSITVCRAHNYTDHLTFSKDLERWVAKTNIDVLLEFMSYERAKLGAGPLVSQIVRILKNVSRGDSGWINEPTFFDDSLPLPEDRLHDPKLILYSAHDTTLESVLAALKVFDGSIPPYASQLVFELYREQEVCVRLWYNKGVDDPWKKQISLCSKDCCSVEDLEARLSESMMASVSDYLDRCKIPIEQSEERMLYVE